jgi:hypothetical protein
MGRAFSFGGEVNSRLLGLKCARRNDKILENL